MDYQIVETHSRIELEKAVKDLIKKGWKPQGGLCTYKNVLVGEYNQMIRFMQAMVKE